MRCFFHGDVEAVAICKACHRAICHDCCAEVGSSVACRNRCETDVQTLDALQRRGTVSFKVLPRLYFGMGLLFGIFGLFFLCEGLLSLRSNHADFGGIYMGVFFVFLSAGFILAAQRFRAP